MPVNYNNHVYKTWTGLTKAIKREHPAWSARRISAYAGGLKRNQEGRNKKHGKK